MRPGNRLAKRSSIERQLQQIKDKTFRAYRTHHRQTDHVLRLALIEAEALAWQTGFPQLMFPLLAVEKAESAVTWTERQRKIRQRAVQISFAA